MFLMAARRDGVEILVRVGSNKSAVEEEENENAGEGDGKWKGSACTSLEMIRRRLLPCLRLNRKAIP